MSQENHQEAEFHIDDFHTKIYIRETLFKLSIARKSKRLADAAMRNGRDDLVWYHVEAMAGAITSVANMLWPTRKGYPKKRAAYLRSQLRISDVIDPSVREVRNGYIHFDERIDEHIVLPDVRMFVDMNLAPVGALINIDPELVGRNFDFSQWELSIFGASTRLRDVMNSLGAMEKACFVWLAVHKPRNSYQ